MGISLSPVISNICDNCFEEMAVKVADCKPPLWIERVDDTLSPGNTQLRIYTILYTISVT